MAQVFPRPVARAGRPRLPRYTWWVDVILALVVAALAYGILSLASGSSESPTSPVVIDLSPSALPGYAVLSTLRMAAAYGVSLVFSLIYARIAASSPAAERVMIPGLDILQSIPILSFMPGIGLGMVALFPRSRLGLDLAAVLLIFTSQAWNIAFGFHQSLVTIPRELDEVATIYRLGFWDRFARLELPFGAIALIWNSMMSWAGGWFFLMASEQFTLGNQDFRLPGLGSYLARAASAGDLRALAMGLSTLIVIIVLLDQLLWRPLVAWSEKFKLEQIEATEAAQSPILTALRRSAALHWLAARVLRPLGGWLDRQLRWLLPRREPRPEKSGQQSRTRWISRVKCDAFILVMLGAGTLGAVAALQLLTARRICATSYVTSGSNGRFRPRPSSWSPTTSPRR